MRIAAAVIFAFAATSADVAAQGVSVAPHFGSLGLGADVAVALSDVLSIRGGANFQPYSPKPDLSDIAFQLDLPSPSFSATVDVHPGGGSFRITGGLVYFASDLAIEGILNESVEIGENQYTPAEVGTLTGTLPTRALSPYLGIGVGNAAHASTGFFLDVGVAFHGTPEVELSADGPVSSQPQFQSDLAQEVSEIQDDVDSFKVYPVVAVGVRFPLR